MTTELWVAKRVRMAQPVSCSGKHPKVPDVLKHYETPEILQSKDMNLKCKYCSKTIITGSIKATTNWWKHLVSHYIRTNIWIMVYIIIYTVVKLYMYIEACTSHCSKARGEVQTGNTTNTDISNWTSAQIWPKAPKTACNNFSPRWFHSRWPNSIIFGWQYTIQKICPQVRPEVSTAEWKISVYCSYQKETWSGESHCEYRRIR